MSTKEKKHRSSESGGKLWFLMMEEGFLSGPEIRRLRRKLGAESVLIFLKMSLAALRDDGYIEKRPSLTETFAEQIAFDIEEDLDVVRETIQYCIPLGLIKPVVANQLMQFPIVTGRIKTLTPSAQRMRKLRAERNASQSDGNAQSDEITSQSADSNRQEQKKYSKNNESESYSLNDCLFDAETVARFSDDDAPGTGSASELAPGRESSLTELMELNAENDVGLNKAGIAAYSAATKGGTIYLGSPVDVPLRAMRAWAKRNKERHPEYFTSTGKTGTEGTAAAQDQGETLPPWDSQSTDFQDYTDDDFEGLVDKVNTVPSNKFMERAEEGERKARARAKNSKINHTDDFYENEGNEYATRHFMLNREKREAGYLTTEEISVLMEEFNGYDDSEFYGYFLKNRPNG